MRPQQSSIVIPKAEEAERRRKSGRTKGRKDGGGYNTFSSCRLSSPRSGSSTHSHSGRRPSWAVISRIARPVCNVSSSARAGTRSSKARARRVRTLDRWMAGARDHMPDWKTACASTIVRSMSSELAASTLPRGCREHSYHGYSISKNFDLRADVQAGRGICHGKPERNKA
jgi:hypothetical protein